MTITKALAGVILAGGLLAAPGFAKDITVQMKSQGAAGMMVFEPA